MPLFRHELSKEHSVFPNPVPPLFYVGYGEG
jgi:hypothetical protein